MGNVHSMPPGPASTPTEAHSNVGDIKVLSNPIDKEHDPFRDGYLRYLGYTNEVGESFRRFINRPLYLASYAVATAYVCADTIHKANQSFQRGDSIPRVLLNGGDAFLWQMLASVIVPGYVVNRITYLTRRLVRLKRKKCICTASPMVRYTPVAVGLLAIPFIIHPIDSGVSWTMDNTVRKLYKKENGDGKGR